MAAVFAVLVVGGGVIPVATEVAHAAPAVSVAVGDLALTETDIGTTTVKFPFTLSGPAPGAISVTYAVWNGTATSPADFKAEAGTVTFKAGDVEKDATIKINGDTTVEPTENINIRINAVSGATLGRSWGLIVLVDNDANGVAATPEVSAGWPTAQEGNVGDRRTELPITLSRPPATAVRVRYWDGCVTKDVNFKAGQQIKTVDVGILPDFVPNPDYTIPNGYSVASGTATVPWGFGGVNVRDDDGTAPAAATTVRASESVKGVGAQYPKFYCGVEVQGESDAATISANGRYVSFTSNATNLVPGDTNNTHDVFVKDIWTGAVDRASIGVTGAQLHDRSQNWNISPDGRYVFWGTLDQNAAPGFDIWNETYVYDRVTKTSSRLIDNTDDHFTRVLNPSASADSRYVAFQSEYQYVPEWDPACPVDPNRNCNGTDVWLLDRTTGAVQLVTDGVGGTPSMGWNPVISADGKTVGFASQPDAGFPDGMNQYWVKDLDTGVVEIASVNSNEEPMVGAGITPGPVALSADGQQVAFIAEACNLGVTCPAGNDPTTDGLYHAYVRDRNTGTTTVETSLNHDRFARMTTAVSLSGNGRYITYTTDNPGDIPGWTLAACQYKRAVVQRDRVTGVRTVVSVARNNSVCPTGDIVETYANASSADGSYVTFWSDGQNIVDHDQQIDEDVFVRRLR
jgi:hypothetical protein